MSYRYFTTEAAAKAYLITAFNEGLTGYFHQLSKVNWEVRVWKPF